MVHFQNEFVKLEYTPDSGILEVVYYDLYTYPITAIKENIEVLVNLILEHKIEKVLLDSSNTTSVTSKEKSREVAVMFANGLAKTNVKKVARLQSPAFVLEATVRSNLATLKSDSGMSFQMESFTNREDALDWLMTWDELLLT